MSESPLGSSEWAMADAAPLRSYRYKNKNNIDAQLTDRSVASVASHVSNVSLASHASHAPTVSSSMGVGRGSRRAEGGTRSQIAMAGDDPVETVQQFPSRPSASRVDTSVVPADGRQDDVDSIRVRVARRAQRGQLFDTPRTGEKPKGSGNRSTPRNASTENADDDAAKNAQKSRSSHFNLSGDGPDLTPRTRYPQRSPQPDVSVSALKSKFISGGDAVQEEIERTAFRARMQAKARGGWSLGDSAVLDQQQRPVVPKLPVRSLPDSPAGGTPRSDRSNMSTNRSNKSTDRPSSRIMRPKIRPPRMDSPLSLSQSGRRHPPPMPEDHAVPDSARSRSSRISLSPETEPIPQPRSSRHKRSPRVAETEVVADMNPKVQSATTDSAGPGPGQGQKVKPPRITSVFDLGANEQSEAEKRMKAKEAYAAELRLAMQEMEEGRKKERKTRHETKADSVLPTNFGEARREWEQKKTEEYMRDLAAQAAEQKARKAAAREHQTTAWDGPTSRSRDRLGF